MQAIKGGAAAIAASEGMSVVNSPLTGGPSQGKDASESARAPQFGEVLRQMQAKYGEQAPKPRDIKKTLGKDDFLKIMITQMKNQDPTSPFKAEQMATEIAQFTSVEQLQNVNQNLTKMSTQNRPLEQMAMTNMIGKMVTIDRERFPHQEGQPDLINFALPKNGSSVKVSIISEAGETVFQKDLGTQKAGDVSFTWDGIKTNTLAAKGGNYLYRVDAKDDRGQTIQINPKVRSKVIGVSFEGTEPVFLVGDAKHQDKVTLKSISQIEIDSGAEPSRPMLQPHAEVNPNENSGTKAGAAEVTDAAGKPSFFTFKKGLGSAPTEIQDPKLLDGYIKSRAAAEAQAQIVAQEEKGFPNGLHDDAPVNPPRNEVP